MTSKRVVFTDGEKPFIAIAGEVHNSNSSNAGYMEQVWNKAETLGMNTLLLPVSWEMIEPEEGNFDFQIVDDLIAQAREHQMHIIFLWFGTWKNAQCMYAPAWVKKDLERFKRAEVIKGQNKASLVKFHGMQYTSLSYLCEETNKADSKAFARLMKHIREIDEDVHTVIAVQVENETGLQGEAREHSDEADEIFASTVPQEFVDYVKSHTESMEDGIKQSVENGAASGTWEEVFGKDASEIFSAYYIATYINKVAAAGKAEYDLPMTVNCWLDKGEEAGQYPSGGPVAKVMEVYKYAAPAIDFIAPDIYVQNFHEICEQYMKLDNPLIIPETAVHSYVAPRLVYSIGHYHASCFAPFGFEDIGEPFNNMQGFLFGMDVTDPLLKTPQNVEEYGWCGHTLCSMMDLLVSKYGTNDLQAVISEKVHMENIDLTKSKQALFSGEAGETTMLFDDMGFAVVMNTPMLARRDGVCLMLKDGDTYYSILNGCMLMPFSTNPQKPHFDYLLVEEGYFDNGQWVTTRRLNGDETVFMNFDKYTLLRFKFFTYA